MPTSLPADFRIADGVHREGPWCNRLALERSPYLQQHADNPVDWLPWGEDAFSEAARRDVPIFLSIGYAACHWCHVMAHESFADPTTAALMNERFVNIKVDREERPDIDAFFMEVLLHMNGEAGWPASLWLTPDGRPFQGGTYYPPFFRYGVPAFSHALKGVSDTWGHNQAYALKQADDLCTALAPPAARPAPGLPIITKGLAAIHESFDDRYGGWGYGAKFPMVPRLSLLLESDDERSRACLSTMLDAMDRGGIHDHVGGGFHRYAVDIEWSVPHFEKMLYDNALLAALYLRSWSQLGEQRWMTVGCETLEYMLETLGGSDGLLFSSTDADDPVGEGVYYTWTPEELAAVLGRASKPLAAAYSVLSGGNFEGRSVLNRIGDPALLSAVRERLLAARLRRPPPSVDDKRVLAWNAMAATALALGGRLLGERRYTDAALHIAQGMLAARGDDGLLRVVGGSAPAVLDDYVALGEASVALHEATGEAKWLLTAADIGDEILTRFWDGAVLSLSPLAHGTLPIRRGQWIDSAEPAGAAAAVRLLAVFHALGASSVSHALLSELLGTGASFVEEHPDATPTALRALRRLHQPMTTMVLTGDPASSEHAALRAVLRRSWRPDTLLVEVHPGSDLPQRFGALAGKGEAARVWICEGTSCRLPIREPAALQQALQD